MNATLVKRRVAALLLSTLAATGVGTTVGVVTSAVAPQAAQAHNPGGYLPVKTVMDRASWWMGKYGVIYSQSQSEAKTAPGGEKYRPDCSGFVAMAWHLKKLNTGNDLNTGNYYNLSGTFEDGTAVSSRLSHIAISSLKQGDALVKTGHIQLFDKWANSSKTEYYAYEEYDWGKEGRYKKHTTPSSGWKGVRYNRTRALTSLSTTQWCVYKVATGTLKKRSGPSTYYTGEGTYATGGTFTATTSTIKTTDGKYWRKVAANVWVAGGDGGTISKVGNCFTA
ncbi:MAG: hypothetical protein HOV79_23315 [Hamadaea sp.]|nr:hypothetical protein [Hamadaea sp.]